MLKTQRVPDSLNLNKEDGCATENGPQNKNGVNDKSLSYVLGSCGMVCAADKLPAFLICWKRYFHVRFIIRNVIYVPT